ncbi:MAG TPA: peptidoglycan-binding protein, partial [Candidatus Onthomonas avicola]|nr:peptidoglycan-binding protein [Candidatus Onthomonas avicola]
DASQRRLKGATLTAIIKAFCEAITAGGYPVGIYCNQDWYDNVLDTDALAEYPFWIARYGSNDGKMHTRPNIDGELWGWQYTSKGKVSGISGNVDLDVMYGDYFGTAGGGSSGSSTTTSKGGFDVATLNNVKNGSTGAQVRSLQLLLNGKDKAGLSVDGIAGPKTVAAIKAYQRDKGLSVDGIAGPKTWTAILTK